VIKRKERNEKTVDVSAPVRMWKSTIENGTKKRRKLPIPIFLLILKYIIYKTIPRGPCKNYFFEMPVSLVI